MEFQLQTFNGVTKFSGSYSAYELSTIALTKPDRMLLDEVSNDPKATAADYLLALETIFRRILEAKP